MDRFVESCLKGLDGQALQLKNLIEEKQATIAIVGLGYVGMPLALEFSQQGFVTIGTDSTMEEYAAAVVGPKEALNHFSVEELPIDAIIDVLLLRQRTWMNAEMQMKATTWVLMTLTWVLMTLDVKQFINHHNSIILSLKMTMYAGRFKDLAIPKKVR